MSRNLLIVGAGTYAVVAYEIAMEMGCFDKIGFVDDNAKTTPNGIEVSGTVKDVKKLENEYCCITVAIGNPAVRRALLEKIGKETQYRIVSLISPKAHVSPSARIGKGCVIEPMAVVHTLCELCDGCLVSAGAVINHASLCREGVHVDCNATVEGYCLVPENTKIRAGQVFSKDLPPKSDKA